MSQCRPLGDGKDGHNGKASQMAIIVTPTQNTVNYRETLSNMLQRCDTGERQPQNMTWKHGGGMMDQRKSNPVQKIGVNECTSHRPLIQSYQKKVSFLERRNFNYPITTHHWSL